MTEAQAFSVWVPPTGTLSELTNEARARAATLAPRAGELKRAAERVGTVPSFHDALKGVSVGVIAEVKRSSPSKGAINPGLDLVRQVEAYEAGGAKAISVLTEPTRFGGSIDDLVRARVAVRLPLVKKDFHVDVLQILEARALGASAALVIARALPPKIVRDLMSAAADVGLEILLEVRDERELDLALSAGAKLIGVNNRNLETLEIDPATSLKILPLIPRSVVAIAESGVRSATDVKRIAEAGADAVLVGSELSASRDPEAAVRSLTGVARTGGARQG
ncbi:MAG: indole-3-glycerol phosphate synthase TrpC [Gemmatimonadaceae bacterium]